MWAFFFHVKSHVLAQENLIIASIDFVNHTVPNAIV